jgi:hypothetical protein
MVQMNCGKNRVVKARTVVAKAFLVWKNKSELFSITRRRQNCGERRWN